MGYLAWKSFGLHILQSESNSGIRFASKNDMK